MTRLNSIAAACLRFSLLTALATLASLSYSETAHAQKTSWVSFANQSQQTLDIYTSDLEFLERVAPGRQSDEIDFRPGERVGAFDPNTSKWVATMAISGTGTVIVSNNTMGYQGRPQNNSQGGGTNLGGGSNPGNGGGGGNLAGGGGGGSNQGNGGGGGNLGGGGGGGGSNQSNGLNQGGGAANVVDEVLRLINVERAKRSLTPVARNSTIDALVSSHNQFLAAQPQFPRSSDEAHAGYEGRDQKIKQIADGMITKGEIVGAATPGAGAAKQLVDGWMNSPGHAEILLSPMTGTGLVGVAVDTGREWTYSTVFFADRTNQSNQGGGGQIGGGQAGGENTNGGAGDVISVSILNADLSPAQITINGAPSIEVPAGPSAANINAKEGDVIGFKNATNQGAIRITPNNKTLNIASSTKPTVFIRNESEEQITVFVTTNGVERELAKLGPGSVFNDPNSFVKGSTLTIRSQFGSSGRLVNKNANFTYGNNGLVEN